MGDRRDARRAVDLDAHVVAADDRTSPVCRPIRTRTGSPSQAWPRVARCAATAARSPAAADANAANTASPRRSRTRPRPRPRRVAHEPASGAPAARCTRRRRCAVEEAGRALDVGEQEGDDARRAATASRRPRPALGRTRPGVASSSSIRPRRARSGSPSSRGSDAPSALVARSTSSRRQALRASGRVGLLERHSSTTPARPVPELAWIRRAQALEPSARAQVALAPPRPRRGRRGASVTPATSPAASNSRSPSAQAAPGRRRAAPSLSRDEPELVAATTPPGSGRRAAGTRARAGLERLARRPRCRARSSGGCPCPTHVRLALLVAELAVDRQRLVEQRVPPARGVVASSWTSPIVKQNERLYERVRDLAPGRPSRARWPAPPRSAAWRAGEVAVPVHDPAQHLVGPRAERGRADANHGRATRPPTPRPRLGEVAALLPQAPDRGRDAQGAPPRRRARRAQSIAARRFACSRSSRSSASRWRSPVSSGCDASGEREIRSARGARGRRRSRRTPRAAPAANSRMGPRNENRGSPSASPLRTQALVDERAEPVEHVDAQLARRSRRRPRRAARSNPPHEHRRAARTGGRTVGSSRSWLHAIAPAQRPLALRDVRGARPRQVEPALEPLVDRRRRQEAHAGRGQLDGERHAAEVGDDRGHVTRVGARHREPGRTAPRPRHEQAHRLEGHERLGRPAPELGPAAARARAGRDDRGRRARGARAPGTPARRRRAAGRGSWRGSGAAGPAPSSSPMSPAAPRPARGCRARGATALWPCSSARTSSGAAPGCSRDPHRRRRSPRDQRRVRDRRRAARTTCRRGTRRGDVGRDLEREPRLARATRPGERDAGASSSSRRPDLGELAAHGRRTPSAGSAGCWAGRRASGSAGSRPAAPRRRAGRCAPAAGP